MDAYLNNFGLVRVDTPVNDSRLKKENKIQDFIKIHVPLTIMWRKFQFNEKAKRKIHKLSVKRRDYERFCKLNSKEFKYGLRRINVL